MKKTRIIIAMMLAVVMVLALGLTACDTQHVCQHVCPICGKCTDANCTDPACADKCQGHDVETHVCQHVCPTCGKCTDANCTDTVCADKCKGHDVETHVCQHVCPTCGKCTDANCTDPVCADKCQGHEAAPVLPVISVIPVEVEINAGEEIDLMFGVTVDDESATLIISDDDDFDADVEGEYTITYQATNEAGSVTATRTIKVLPALSALQLEARVHGLGLDKWPSGPIINFKNALYKEISTDAQITVAQSGVWHNTSDSAITLSVAGSYGCAAILTANGVVIEGRDGANNRLMNESNPSRQVGAQTLTINGEEVSVASAFAQNLQIPAGGFAVIIQAGYAGTSADSDGRGFMNYDVIATYGNVVRLLWVDSQEVITPYVDQAPTVSGNTTVLVAVNDATFSLETAVKEGVTATDDNGTFSVSDDIKITDVTVKDTGNFDVTKVGVYTITMSVQDENGNVTEFTRDVEVTDQLWEMKIGNNSFKCLPQNVAVDEDLSAVGKYSLIIYTPSYTGEINYANGYGVAIVLDQYGAIVSIFDGADGKYYDATHKTGVKDASLCTPANYAKEALASRQEGEYVIVAPNASANNAEGGSRKFLLNNRTIGAQVTLPDVQFAAKTYTITIDDKTFSTTQYAFNSTEITDKTAAKYQMIVFTKAFSGTFTTNAYGAAIVIDQYGTLVKIYDGANVGLYTVDGKAATAGFTATDYATVAFGALKDGEMLVIFPNDGTNAADSARTFAMGLRGVNGARAYCGETVEITGFTFLEKEKDNKTITIDDKSFTAEEGKWAYNDATVVATNAASYSMVIYDKNYTGTVSLNSYGAAIVLDQYGTLVRIYDGANVGLYTVDGKAATAGFTATDYATVAFGSLQEGEMLVIFPNDGTNAADSARTFALGLRGVNGARAYCGETATLTGFEFESAISTKTQLVIGDATLDITAEQIIVNATAVSADAVYVFTTDFLGQSPANGWGEAFVVDKDGKILRIYDGISGKYYDENNTAGVALANAEYLTRAFASLKANEILVVGPNAGDKTVRDFMSSYRTIGATLTIIGAEITASDNAPTTVYLENTAFMGVSVVNAEVAKPAETDFAIYTYGYSGIVTANNYGQVLVINESGNIVKIYDCYNGKYYDNNNATGIARTDDLYTTNTVMSVAFKNLQPGETMIAGLNGGRDNGAARKFFATSLAAKFGKPLVLSGVNATASTTEVQYASITRGNKTWYQTMDKVAVDGDEYAGTPAFRVYNYGFTGTPIASIQYGVAIKIDTTTNQIVAFYDSANGRLHDAEHPAGASYSDNTIKTIIDGLEENEILLVVQNAGTTGNALRAFVLGTYVAETGGDRAPGTVLVVDLPKD